MSMECVDECIGRRSVFKPFRVEVVKILHARGFSP